MVSHHGDQQPSAQEWKVMLNNLGLADDIQQREVATLYSSWMSRLVKVWVLGPARGPSATTFILYKGTYRVFTRPALPYVPL